MSVFHRKKRPPQEHSFEVVPLDPGAAHFSRTGETLALRLNDRVYPLGRFVDPRAVMVVRKSAGDQELLALERPGLWNGAMADWVTLFVEVPLETFNPVKTILDLLRPEHQPPKL